MSYPVTFNSEPHFGARVGHHGLQEYRHQNNFHWRPPHTRPIYHNRNDFSRNQHSFNTSEEHWCETCDRGFNTLDQLEKHKQQHQKCNIDGCQFVAHPKVITKHIQMQHSSGLYKRIAKLDNPEEIKKWREERKKKYPTKENIEKKSAEIKEKIERGEKMGLRQDRFQRNGSQGHGVKRKNFGHSGNYNEQQTKQNFVRKLQIKKFKKDLPQKKVYTVAPLNETRKLRPFTGIQNIDMDSDTDDDTEQPESNFDIEDDDCEPVNTTEKVKSTNEPIVCGALSSLMCDYGSSDEENNDIKEVANKIEQDTDSAIENENKFTVKPNVSTEEKKAESVPMKEINENKSDDDSGPEEVKVVKTAHVDIAVETNSNNNPATKPVNKFRNSNVSEHKRQPFIRSKPKVPSTLLHKLLHREVQHERNVILQCVRYIVQNNYFDKK